MLQVGDEQNHNQERTERAVSILKNYWKINILILDGIDYIAEIKVTVTRKIIFS